MFFQDVGLNPRTKACEFFNTLDMGLQAVARQVVLLITHFHLVSWLKMGGAIPLLSLYALQGEERDNFTWWQIGLLAPHTEHNWKVGGA
jgi:hypothetical protein